VAQAPQHHAPALILERPTVCTTNISVSKAVSGSERDDAINSILLVQNIRQVSAVVHVHLLHALQMHLPFTVAVFECSIKNVTAKLPLKGLPTDRGTK
jgi:hypothetical protein